LHRLALSATFIQLTKVPMSIMPHAEQQSADTDALPTHGHTPLQAMAFVTLDGDITFGDEAWESRYRDVTTIFNVYPYPDRVRFKRAAMRVLNTGKWARWSWRDECGRRRLTQVGPTRRPDQVVILTTMVSEMLDYLV
jgi:hypothetical protein